MKKSILISIVTVLLLSIAAEAPAVMISFLKEDKFSNVDKHARFSANDKIKDLRNDSLSLLNGTARLSCNSNTLSHTGTKGLGIMGGHEDGQIDWHWSGPTECLTIAFDAPIYFTGFEVRSLYADYPPVNGGDEYGYTCFWDTSRAGEGSLVFFGQETEGNGTLSLDENDIITSPWLMCTEGYYEWGFEERLIIDRIEFRMTQEADYYKNAFSLARLYVDPIPNPEPSTLLLMTLSLGTLAAFKRKT